MTVIGRHEASIIATLRSLSRRRGRVVIDVNARDGCGSTKVLDVRSDGSLDAGEMTLYYKQLKDRARRNDQKHALSLQRMYHRDQDHVRANGRLSPVATARPGLARR